MPGPYHCVGEHPSQGGGICKSGTRGRPATIKGKCTFDPRCGEKRCATHCKCARMGWRQGLNAGRAKNLPTPKVITKVKATSKAMPKAAPKALAGPVGHPLALNANTLPVHEWFKQMIVDVRDATEVFMATFMYDHPQLHGVLLKRLQGRSSFSLNILIDESVLKGNKPWHQKQRLTALVEAGAIVYVCTGHTPKGIYHRKAVIVDRRFMYTGGANMTNQADAGGNKELIFRMVGPPVLETLAILHEDMRTAVRRWDKA